jgi:hypothetical protein
MNDNIQFKNLTEEISELFSNLQGVAYFMRLISDQQDAFTKEIKCKNDGKKITFERLPRVFNLTHELFHGKLPELIRSFSNIILKLNPCFSFEELCNGEKYDPVSEMINLLKSYEDHLTVSKFKTPMNSENSEVENDIDFED